MSHLSVPRSLNPGHVLYYVETPLQLFSAICAYYAREEDRRPSTRYLQCVISDKFEKAEEYSQKLVDLELFDEVSLVPPFPYDQAHFGIQYFTDYLFRYDKMKAWFFERYPMLKGVTYCEIVTSAIHRFVSYVNCCNGRQVKTYLIEDGIASFDGEMFVQLTVLDRIVRLSWKDPLGLWAKDLLKPLINFLTRDKLSLHIQGLMLFEITDRVRERYKGIELIQNQLPNAENENVFEALFPVTTYNLYKGHRFVYLSTTDLDKESQVTEEACFGVINSNLDGTLLLRSHPRERKQFESTKEYAIDSSGDLWESLCAKGLIAYDSVLFSMCSTAQLNPKLIFGEEPFLVFLYELLPESSIFDKAIMRKTSDEARELYSNPSKIFIPKTLDELAVLTNSISSIIDSR